MAQAELIARLQQGIEVWNHWRATHEAIQPDLIAADLQGLNLIGANLWKANLWGAKLWGADLREADLGEANLWGADLSGANLTGADLSGTTLWKADLRGADGGKASFWEADLREADLRGADLTEANLCGANLWQADLRGVNLKAVTLDSATRIAEKWRLVWEIINGNGASLNLGDVDLQEAYLWRADLRGASLIGTNLWGADLREADLQGADLWNANLQQTDLSQTNLSQADLWKANLQEADLSQADLTQANLREADLSGVQALETNFTAVTLTGACIEAWQINQETKLNRILCDYLYLKGDQQERCPRDLDKTLAPGEFTKLFQPTETTLNLAFKDGVHWQAFLLTFQILQADWGQDNISIQAFEAQSEGVLLIRLQVAPDLDLSILSERAWQLYEMKQHLLSLNQPESLNGVQKPRTAPVQSSDLLEVVKLLAQMNPAG
ncbi:MAG: pentapeptide repeat-containing protein [Microcoleaceae cyanobacterium]